MAFWLICQTEKHSPSTFKSQASVASFHSCSTAKLTLSVAPDSNGRSVLFDVYACLPSYPFPGIAHFSDINDFPFVLFEFKCSIPAPLRREFVESLNVALRGVRNEIEGSLLRTVCPQRHPVLLTAFFLSHERAPESSPLSAIRSE